MGLRGKWVSGFQFNRQMDTIHDCNFCRYSPSVWLLNLPGMCRVQDRKVLKKYTPDLHFRLSWKISMVKVCHGPYILPESPDDSFHGPWAGLEGPVRTRCFWTPPPWHPLVASVDNIDLKGKAAFSLWLLSPTSFLEYFCLLIGDA